MNRDFTKEEVELILAKIWENKNEPDKLFLIIDHAVGIIPNKLVEKYKEQLGYR